MPETSRPRRTLRLWGTDYPVPTLAGTLGLALAGALLARAAGTPLPWLLGPVVATGLAAILGLRVAGAPPAFPTPLRQLFVPVIGVSIGGAFTPALLAEAQVWGASLLALLLYVPLVHLLGLALCLRAGGIDRATAWFGTMPGGFVEALTLGEEHGADPALLAAMQFLRLILCILLLPVAFSLWQGEVVGSAAGMRLPGSDHPLGLGDAALLLACAVLGFLAGTRTGLPAGVITGPLLLSGAAHLAGLVEGQPPAWAVQATQLVIGTSLGVRFAGVPRRALLRAGALSGTIVLATLLLALLAGIALGHLVAEPPEAIVLAFAPGGLVEMSLVALSLGVSPLYVTLHHVLRIVLAVAFGRAGWSWIRRAGQ